MCLCRWAILWGNNRSTSTLQPKQTVHFTMFTLTLGCTSIWTYADESNVCPVLRSFETGRETESDEQDADHAHYTVQTCSLVIFITGPWWFVNIRDTAPASPARCASQYMHPRSKRSTAAASWSLVFEMAISISISNAACVLLTWLVLTNRVVLFLTRALFDVLRVSST